MIVAASTIVAAHAAGGARRASADTIAQAQVLELLRTLQRETEAAVLLITHDLGVVATLCARVLVMHDGRLVEDAPVERIFVAPQHPATAALIRALPRLTVAP